jgi:hypothetical protein
MQRDDMQNYEGLEEDLNNLSDDDLEPHLTRKDYEKSLDLESMFNNEESINNLGESAYQGLTNSIMVELQHKYDLRPRDKNSANVPPKNILSRNKTNEAFATKPPTNTQAAQKKTVETRATQTKRPENTEVPTRETEKNNWRFQFRKQT